MSTKMLQTFLTMLKKQQVQASTVVSFLESDDSTSVLGLDSLLSNLKSYGDEDLPKDIVSIMIKNIELIITQKKDQLEEKMNKAIVENSLTNYSEDVTSAPVDINDRSVINSYDGQETGTTLEYYVLHCPTEASSFNLGDLLIKVVPLNPIPFTGKDGEKKFISYDYRLDITHVNDPIGVEREFARIKLEVIYNLIGMTFLKETDTMIFKSTQLITVQINTATYFKTLANSYNVYFNNMKKNDGTRLSEIPGIENCQFDSNGLILVPQLFYLSSIYTDGDLGGRPYIWSANKALPPLDLNVNKYRFSVNPGRESSKKDIPDAIFSLCSRLIEAGIQVSSSGPHEDSNSKTINLSIDGYNSYSEDGGTFQSNISSKLNLESKVSSALRKLVRQGYLSVNSYLTNHTRGGPGSEGYSFMYNSSTKTIESSYSRSDTKFMLFFNRSAVTCVNDDGNPTTLVKGIIDRNNSKANHTGLMIETLDKNDQLLPFENQGYPAVPGDYLPTSFMPILFEKSERKNGIYVKNSYLGISFIPYGFTRYVSTDMNVSSSESAFAIYGSDISLTPVSVRRIIKLSNKPEKITNISQIVIESSIEPQFTGDQPLLTTRLDDTHFLSLFRSTSKVVPATQNKWVYASNYMETLDMNTSGSDNTTSLTMFINPGNDIIISKRAMLRYATESLGSDSEFTKVVLDNVDMIFDNDDFVELPVFCRLFINEKLSVPSIPKKFFSLLEHAANQGVVNESVVSIILGMVNISDDSVINFIRSIKLPVKRNEYPTFTGEMQMEITSSMNRGIEDVISAMRTINDTITGKNESQIINIASEFSGTLRSVIEMIGREIGEVPSTPSTIVSARNTVIERIVAEASRPVLPSMLGFQIDIEFIRKASNTLSSETFIRLIKAINAELNADSYEDLIRRFLERGTEVGAGFVITPNSAYRYTITFESHLRDHIVNMSGGTLPELNYEVLITDERVTSYEFGKQIYDHNIHAMFEINIINSEGKSINDIIVDTLQSDTIYYSQLDGSKLKADLSLVSLYGIPENLDDPISFFLPYNYNSARLTIRNTEWSSNMGNFRLLTKTLEIEFVTETTQLEVIRELCYDVITMSANDQTPFRSVVLSSMPISKAYEREGVQSHFFFTNDVSTQLSSGSYSTTVSPESFSVFLPQNLEKLIGDEVEVNIYPINPTIVKYSKHDYDNQNILVIIKLYSNNNIDKISVTEKILGKAYKKQISDAKTFEDQFVSYGNVRSTMLITRNSRGIYTTALGNLDTEARIAKGNVTFNHNRASLDMSEFTELTTLTDSELNSIEERFLQAKIDIENNKLDEQNIKHNLGLILSTIRWNSKQVENYRFINNETPKWIRFSPDSYFMAIAFHSGVKIYIASGDQFVFCTNLPHEGVSDIIFGNNSLCITTQYQNSDKPFSKLWIATSGILVKRTLDYYTVVDGDAAQIKYITGSTNKERKNQTVSVNDGKVFYGGIQVQSAVPIYNHNVYFFSPTDEYLIWNKKGSFSVIKVSEASKGSMTFESFNGVNTTDRLHKLPVRGIESGVWISPTVFMGYSYNENNPYIRTRVIIDVAKKSVIQTDIQPEFPTMKSTETMIVDSYTKTHPLFTYLIAEKEKYTDVVTGKVGQNGIWLWDLYISLTQREVPIERGIIDTIVGDSDRTVSTWINFHTTDGLHSSYMLPDYTVPPFIDTNNKISNSGVDIDGQSISDYLNTIVKIMEIDSIEDESGEHIQSMKWLDKTLFVRSQCQRNDDMILQCIDGNYFAFNGPSIYIWNYRNSKDRKWTELSHIDSNGYQRMSFEDHHIAIIISSSPNAGIIYGDQLNVKRINLNDDVKLDRDASDVSSIVKHIKETYETDYFVNTEVTFEAYTNADILNPVTLDTRTISSAMCLNRYADYTTKNHRDANKENSFIHDNLLITCHDNVVKIIPLSVPVSNNPDGLTSEWYKEQVEDNPEYWMKKKDKIDKYIRETEEIFHFIKNRKIKSDGFSSKVNMVFLKQVMGTRTNNNIDLGFKELSELKFRTPGITDEEVEYGINLMSQIFKIFGSVVYITDPNRTVDAVDDFWASPLSEKPFAVKMKSIPEEIRHQKYDQYVAILSQYVGDKFISYNAGMAFNKIREIYMFKGLGTRTVTRSLKEISTLIDEQESNVIAKAREMRVKIDPNTKEIIRIMRHIINLPYIKISGVNLTKYADYVNRIFTLKDELRRVETMTEKNTRYDIYHAMEKKHLDSKFLEFLIKKLAITSKINDKNEKTDYQNCLTSRFTKVKKPEFMKFDNKVSIIDGKFVYVNSYGSTVHIPMSDYDRSIIEEKKRMIDEHNVNIKSLNESNEEGSMRAIEVEKNFIRTLISEINELIRKDEENFIYTDGSEVNIIDKETFNVLEMKEVIKDVYNAVYNFLKEKAFNILKGGFSISLLLGVLDRRKIKKDEKEIEAYARQFPQFLKDSLSTIHDQNAIEVGMVDLVRTFIEISSGIKFLESVDDLYNILVKVFEQRFPESLYNLYDVLPDELAKIIETSDEKISKDSNPRLLETNIPYINKMYKFYGDSLKRGYYLSNDAYNKTIDDVKKRFVPMLWKYRQGVCNDVIPVVCIKLTFKNPVVYEPSPSHKQRETDDLVFKFAMDDDRVKHGEKYGSIKVNLKEIIDTFQDRCTESYNDGTELLIRNDGSSCLGERISKVSAYDAIYGIGNDCDILKEAVARDIISESKAISLIERDLPFVNSLSSNGRPKIDSIDHYNELLRGSYRMLDLTPGDSSIGIELHNVMTKSIEASYNTRPHFMVMDTPLKYKFNYIRPGVEFDRVDVSMIYEEKYSETVDETVDMSRKNIIIGNTRPYFQDVRLLKIDNDKPYIYRDSSNEGYIIWYGNTIVNEIPRAYIVTQKLSDRSMKTYHYIKYKSGNNKKIQEEAHAMKLYFNYINNENEEIKKVILKTHVNFMKVNSDGDFSYSETIISPDRKFVKGKGYEEVEIDQVVDSHIGSLINTWELQPDMDEKKFSDAQIVSHITKNHEKRTITVSNYRAGRHSGSIVEVFTIEDNKIVCTANWNFYGLEIKNFDFNSNELFLVGSVLSFNGFNVRIGSMDLNKRIPERKSIFINVFDREVNLINPSIKELMSVTIDTKDTTYITYDNGKTSSLVIINGKASYEKKFKDEKIGTIKSMRPSTKNGYVALYFEAINRSEIWTCDGSLYDVYDGECNWM